MTETYKKKDDKNPKPKTKRIDIPNTAKAEISRMNERLEIYLSGVIVGMGIKGKWDYDAQSMCILVEDK